MEKKELTIFERHPIIKDIISLIFFVALIIIGTITVNAYIFRSYNVVGVSMENTLHNSDRVIVNRLAVSIAHFNGEE